MPMMTMIANSAMRTVPASTIGEIDLAVGMAARSSACGDKGRGACLRGGVAPPVMVAAVALNGARMSVSVICRTRYKICAGGHTVTDGPDLARKLLGFDRQESLIATP